MLSRILRDGSTCRVRFAPATVHRHIAGLFLATFLTAAMAGTTNLTWHWSNPHPFGNNITALAYGGTNTAYVAACEKGQLYSTTDLDTWTPQYTGTRKSLRAAGYMGERLIVTGEAGVVLTGPSPDDLTLIELGTTDWLESLVITTTQAVAVGDNGAVYTSPDGVTWTRRNPGFTTWLRGIAHNPSSGLYVAVGEGGLVATSPDAITWTKRSSGVTANLNRVIWSGGAFIAVGEGGVGISSSNGTSNWRTATTGITLDLHATAVDDIRETVAVGAGAVILDATLGTGRDWKNEINPNRLSPPPSATYYSALWDGSRFLLGGRAGLLVQGTRQSFSYNWTPYSSPTRSWLWDAAVASATGTNVSASLVNGSVVLSTNRTTNTFYSAVGQGPVLLQSDNGISWLTALAPASASGVVYLGVAGRQDKLLAVGTGGSIAISLPEYEPSVSTNSFTNNAQVITVVLTNAVNTVGLTWSAAASGTTADLQGVCLSDNLAVVTGANGVILTSPDGTTWTPRTSPRSTFLSCVEAFPGGYVASGDLGTLLYSANGSVWENRSPGTTNWIYKVRWRGGQLVAVGQNGSVYTSPDGQNWTSRSSGTTSWLNDVVHIEGTYYAAGAQGTVLASADAIVWNPVDSITGKTIYGLATENGQLIAVGAEGIILRAQAGAFPSSVQFLKYPKTADEGLFLFSGSADQIFRLDTSTNLIDWVEGPQLEFTDSQGVLLFLSTATNNPVQQFFKTVPVP